MVSVAGLAAASLPWVAFLGRRVLGLVPTLLGVTLLVFLLLRALPTDPVEMEAARPGARGRLTSESLAELRRSLHLDLPVVLNLDVQDRRRQLDRAVALLLDPRSDEEARSAARLRLGRQGLFALDALRRREGAGGRAQGQLQDLARRLVGQGAEPWTGWSERRPQAVAEARQLLDGLLGTGPLARPDAYARVAGELVPLAMRHLLAAGTAEPVRDRLASVLGAVIGRDPRLPSAPEGRRRALRDWRSYWHDGRLDYLELGAVERLLASVTRTQYGEWLRAVLSLDFGHSLRDGRPVIDKLAEALPRTVLLSLAAALVAFGLAIPLGAWAATRAGSLGDRVVSAGLLLLYSTPSFWMAMVLVLFLAAGDHLTLLPARGLSSPGAEAFGLVRRTLDLAWHLILPVICLAHFPLAAIARYQRGALLETLGQDFIRTARAKGLAERRVLYGHALRHALLPVITLVGQQVPLLISGSVVVERIFDIPGTGLLVLEAVEHLDYPVLLAVVTLTAVLTVAGLLLSDLLYALADPRLRPRSARRAAPGGPA